MNKKLIGSEVHLKVAGLRTWIARGETALRATTLKPGGGTR